jgi:hypothetical protein
MLKNNNPGVLYQASNPADGIILHQRLDLYSVPNIMGVVFPHVNSLTFDHCIIESEEALYCLVQMIYSFPAITTVCFVDAEGTPKQQGYPLRLLVHLMPKLKIVYYDPVRGTGGDIQPLIEEARRSTTLKTLQIGSYSLTEQNIKGLFDLIENGLIRTLRLDKCNLGETDFIILAYSIHRSSIFKTLDLCETQLDIRPIVQLRFMDIVGERHPSFRCCLFVRNNIIHEPLQTKWRILDFWTALCAPLCIPRIGARSPLSMLSMDILRLLTQFIVIG